MQDQASGMFLKNQCPYCQRVVEVDAHLVGEMVTCPNERCGKVFRIAVPQGRPAKRGSSGQRIHRGETEDDSLTAVSDETLLFKTHPAFIRRRPLKALGVAVGGIVGLATLGLWANAHWELRAVEPNMAAAPEWLLLSLGCLLAGGALVMFLWWWVLSLFTTVTVTNKRTTFQEGIISRETSEVQHDDVRNLQIDQNILERMLGIGDIAISSSGQDDMEIRANGIPSPDRLAKVIRKYQ
jgi:hypothetical protein